MWLRIVISVMSVLFIVRMIIHRVTIGMVGVREMCCFNCSKHQGVIQQKQNDEQMLQTQLNDPAGVLSASSYHPWRDGVNQPGVLG